MWAAEAGGRPVNGGARGRRRLEETEKEEASREETGSGCLPPRLYSIHDDGGHSLQAVPAGTVGPAMGLAIKGLLLVTSSTPTGRRPISPLPLCKLKLSEIEGLA